MNKQKKTWFQIFMLMMLAWLGVSYAKTNHEMVKKQKKINHMAEKTLEKLFSENSNAKALYEKSFAYAVFDQTKFALGITGSGGVGLASKCGEGMNKVYMKMGSAGVGLGLGGQKSNIVFLFDTKDDYQKFLIQGIVADVSANAVAGKDGVNEGSTFKEGIAKYELTDKGLLAQADVSGKKFWVAEDLNETAVKDNMMKKMKKDMR